MAEIKMPVGYKIVITEYERGWGSKVDEIKYFDTEHSAITFCKDYNSFNNDEDAPDWYMVAEYVGRVG